MSHVEHIQSVGLSENHREELLDRMDRSDSNHAKAGNTQRDRRVHRRWIFREIDIPVTVVHPAGGVARLLVCARNLSAGGMSFLHNGFLHELSECKVSLRNHDGDMTLLQGRVVGCRYVERMLHEVGLRFDARINPAHFVMSYQTSDGSKRELVEYLPGRVLYVDDSVADRTLMRFMLETCGTQLATACSGIEALQVTEDGRFKVLITELSLPGFSGLEMVEMLRSSGYTNPIIGVTADERPEIRMQAIARGCDEVLVKPVDLRSLTPVLRKYLNDPSKSEKTTSEKTERVIASTLWNDTRMRPLILGFLDQLDGSAQQLRLAIDMREWCDAARTCLSMKGAAAGHGYPQICEAARDLHGLIEASSPTEMLQRQFKVLADLCLAARQGRGSV